MVASLPCLNIDGGWEKEKTSQKSCVNIWFGLVEIGGMLILKGGGRSPLLGGVTCDLQSPFSNLAKLFSQKSCENLVRIG